MYLCNNAIPTEAKQSLIFGYAAVISMLKSKVYYEQQDEEAWYIAEFLSRNAIIASALHTSICAVLHSEQYDPRYPSYTRVHVIVQEQSDAVSDNGDTPGVPEFRYVNDIVRILR